MATDSRHSVLVSRIRGAPAVTVDITREGTAIAMAFDDFVTALVGELGSPALTFTAAQLEAKVRAASARIVEQMKAERARVP